MDQLGRHDASLLRHPVLQRALVSPAESVPVIGPQPARRPSLPVVTHRNPAGPFQYPVAFTQEPAMMDQGPHVVHREIVRVGETEMMVEYSDVVWHDFELPPSLVLSGVDYYAQLDAVRTFLSWQDRAAATWSDEIDKAGERVRQSGREAREWFIEDQIELFHRSVYEDAARSMAAVGMLAPLIESLFRRLARALKRDIPRKGSLARWMTDLVKEHGLHPAPSELEITLDALFAYRNQMFHQGFEWPKGERLKFKQRIADSNWSKSWFDEAVYGERPWIYYLSAEYVIHCLEMIEQVFQGVSTLMQARGCYFGRDDM